MFKSLVQIFKSKPTVSHQAKTDNPLSRQDLEGWIIPYSASELLNTELRQRYLALLWQQVSMSREMFDNLYQKPIERYAEMVQLLPASESHHHAHLGGMLDHGLEVISFAAKLRQNYVLPPNAAPEEQAEQKDAWTAATIYLALVHDVGKSIVDIEIHLKGGKRWFAWNGVPTESYKFKYIKQRDYALHPVLGSFIAHNLIPTEAFDWLATYPEAFSALMYAMSGHYDKAGVLSEIIQKADQRSVALALGGDITKLVQKPVVSFAKQLVLALRHLVSQKLKISEKGPGDGWLTEDGLWLMSKTTADQIRVYLMEQGISVPRDNRKLFDEMQAHNVIERTVEDTAIWHCQLKSDAGWKPKDKFSLLRVKPELIWANFDDRPALFAGTIRIASKEENNDTEKTVPNMDISIPEVNLTASIEAENSNTVTRTKEIVHQEDETGIQNRDNESVDFLLNMFAEEETVTVEKTSEPPETEAIIKPAKAEAMQSIIRLTAEIQETKPEISLPAETTMASIEGQQFVDWLKNKLLNEKLTFNDRTAKIHIVDNSLFIVSPSSFELLLQKFFP
ncbi:MobH family relaxase [Pasteurella sp. PK-2025]|uniref:MobH family relaxase n=1 Tax=Pasteurella sp. PK-2025 TaxID=3413133 RepID=UPI003C71F9BA